MIKEIKALDDAFCKLIDAAKGTPMLYNPTFDELSDALTALEMAEVANSIHVNVLEHTLKAQDNFLCEYLDAYKTARAEYFINVSERGSPFLDEYFRRFD
jgi:hypothetical protein